MLLWALRRGALKMLAVLGCITLIRSGIRALYEYDRKKVVALSTLFHLGVIVLMGCNVGLLLVLFHIILHAFYKRLCFIMVGWVIILGGHEQDLRRMTTGGLLRGWVGVIIVSVVLNLIGLVYYRGWASKDVLIEFGLLRSLNIFLIMVLVFGFGCRLGYSLNLVQFCKKIIRQYNEVTWEWGAGWVRMVFLICYTSLGVVIGVYILSLGGFYLECYISSFWGKMVYLVVSLLVIVFSSS